MGLTELQTIVDLHKKTYDLLLWLNGQSRSRPALLKSDQSLVPQKSNASTPLSDGRLTAPPKQPPLKNLNVFANPSSATSIMTNDSNGLTGLTSRIINIINGVDGLTGKIPQGPLPPPVQGSEFDEANELAKPTCGPFSCCSALLMLFCTRNAGYLPDQGTHPSR